MSLSHPTTQGHHRFRQYAPYFSPFQLTTKREGEVRGIGWAGTPTGFEGGFGLHGQSAPSTACCIIKHSGEKGGDSGAGQLVGTNQARLTGWPHIVQAIFQK